jgi:hypothetical protein
MVDLEEGLKVLVRQSNCGYKGPAILIGPVYGSSWLARTIGEEGLVFLVRAEFLDPLKEEIPVVLSKDERKELKRKLKAERKNHKPRGDSGSRR